MPTVWFISDSELETGKTGASKPTGHNLCRNTIHKVMSIHTTVQAN